ncbi:MAG: carboxypeptidase regulatory-like domain-containing protein [Gemmatimonadota bacterium]
MSKRRQGWSFAVSLAAFVALFSPAHAHAQSNGTLLGRVVDAETGAPVSGAQVRVTVPVRIAVTSASGRFVLSSLPPGRRTLQLQALGYAPVTIEGIEIPAGRTIETRVELTPSAVEVDPIIVTADRFPLIEPEISVTHEVLPAVLLRELPVTNVADAIELAAGVSEGRFRGGRIGQEAVVVDGLAIKNQLEASSTGQAVEYSPNSLEEIDVITGGFGAEVGSALSGVIRYVTRSGNPDRWKADINWQTDSWAPASASPGFNEVGVTLDGPLPLAGGGATLFIDVLAQGLLDADPHARGATCVKASDASPALAAAIRDLESNPQTAQLHCPFESEPLPHQAGDNLIGFLRADIPLAANKTLTATLHHNRRQGQLFTPELKYNSSSQLGQRTTATTGMLSLEIASQGTDRATTFIARLAAQRLDRYLGALDLATVDQRFEIGGFGFSDQKFAGEAFTRLPVQTQLDTGLAVPGYRAPGGFTGSPFGPAAEGIFNTDGTTGIAAWSRSDWLGADVIVELQTAERNTYRAGLTSRFFRAENYERIRSYLAGSAPNFTRFFPAQLAGWVETTLRPEELFTITAGVRAEGFKSGLSFRQVRADFLSPEIDTRWRFNVTPRLGIAGAFRNSAGRSSFQVSIARIAQPPDFQFFIDNAIGDSLRIDVRRQGNPNLAFEQGRAFEFGFNHLFTEQIGLGVTLYRRELTDLVTGNLQVGGTQPGQFSTGDRGTVNGGIFTLRARLPGARVRFGYTIQEATGLVSGAIDDTTSVPFTEALEFPLAFDRRHSMNAVLLLGRAAGDRARTSGLGASPWGLAVTATLESGFPIQREIQVRGFGEGPPAIERLPWKQTLDVRATREFGSFPGCARCALRVVFEAQNVLNRENVVALRRDTGTLSPSLEIVEQLAAAPVSASFPIPRESQRYSAAADLDANGLIDSDEFSTVRFAAALDRNDPSLLFGSPRQLRLGIGVSF